MLGELYGKKTQAEARLGEWPTLSDEKVVEAATDHIICSEQYRQLLKKLKKQVFDA
jgi:ABC-type Fe3+-hydroxamate transport system substrate-binding protein